MRYDYPRDADQAVFNFLGMIEPHHEHLHADPGSDVQVRSASFVHEH